MIDPADYTNKDGSFFIHMTERTDNYTMPATHIHDHPEIYYLLSGARYYFIKDRTYYIARGDLVLIRPNELHKTLDAGAPSHKRVLIHFDSECIIKSGPEGIDIIRDMFEKGSPVLHIPEQNREHIESLIRDMFREIADSSRWFDTSLKSLLLQLLISAGRCGQKKIMEDTARLDATQRKVQEIIDYINENYSSDISLTDISKKFYLSSSYLSKIFKKTTGFNLIEYLNSVRIREARRILCETGHKIIDVADEAGFSSISQFGRVFKAQTGLSPLQYRQASGLGRRKGEVTEGR